MKLNPMTIRIEMAKRQFSGARLAELAGLSRQTVSAILHGKDCAEATAGKLANALGVDVEELMEVVKE